MIPPLVAAITSHMASDNSGFPFNPLRHWGMAVHSPSPAIGQRFFYYPPAGSGTRVGARPIPSAISAASSPAQPASTSMSR